MQRYEIIANFALLVKQVPSPGEGIYVMMAEAKSIECLSLVFTVGVVVGTMVPAGAAAGLPGLILPIIALPCFFRHSIRNWPEQRADALLMATFLFLGLFCALNARLIGPSARFPLQVFAEDTAHRLRTFISALPFPSDETAPLLKALLTGDRSSLSQETVTAFRGSGASHLLALSGLHIGIIYLIFDKLSWALGRSPAARHLRYLLIVGGAAFFTLMTGAGPSIVRAFLFIAINETLRLLQRPRKAVRVLCLALLVQLVLDPSAASQLGFQLSYLAMAGIFLLYPLLEKWYPEGSRFNPLRRIWQAAALSISCQVFTGPLAWYRFHTFPRYFLLTNLMAIPLTTGVMASALTTIALSAAGICPAALYTVTDGLCRLLVNVLEIISSL